MHAWPSAERVVQSECKREAGRTLLAKSIVPPLYPPRKGLLDTRRQWMDLWGKGTAEREFAREATPPGLAHAYVRDLLCP